MSWDQGWGSHCLLWTQLPAHLKAGASNLPGGLLALQGINRLILFLPLFVPRLLSHGLIACSRLAPLTLSMLGIKACRRNPPPKPALLFDRLLGDNCFPQCRHPFLLWEGLCSLCPPLAHPCYHTNHIIIRPGINRTYSSC